MTDNKAEELKASNKRPREEENDIPGSVVDADEDAINVTPSSVADTPIALTPVASNSQQPSSAGPPKKSSGHILAGKKVPMHLLEKRRLGRIKAAEEFSKKLKHIGIEKVESNNTTSFIKPITAINLKNYSSTYLKSDDQVLVNREKNAIQENKQQQDKKTEIIETETATTNGSSVETKEKLPAIVIDPGSEYLKIGFSTDEKPVIIPNCVATLRKGAPQDKNLEPQGNDQYVVKDTEDFLENERIMRQNFLERMRYYKRKVSPAEFKNQVLAFNSKHANVESIPIKQDIHRPKWINEPVPGKKILFGTEASLCDPSVYDIRYPFANMNVDGLIDGYYQDSASISGPLSLLWNDIYSLLINTFETHLGLKFSELKNYDFVLIIPDLYTRPYVENFIRMVLYELGISRVAIMKQSVSITYGAGLSQPSCIVDIGASNIKISCLIDGTVVPNSEINLNYGSHDLNYVLGNFLKKMEFPVEFDIKSRSGNHMLENLKRQYCTFEDSDVTVQLFSNCIKYAEQADKNSTKTDFKIFDEVFLTPLSFFYPKIIQQIHGLDKYKCFEDFKINESFDIYSGFPNNPLSKSQSNLQKNQGYCDSYEEYVIMQKVVDVLQDDKDTSNEQSKSDDNDNDANDEDSNEDSGNTPETESLNYYPLDKAIIESIVNATISCQQYTKLKAFYNNILVVGGGCNVPNLDVLLADRLNLYRPRMLATNYLPSILKGLETNLKKLNSNVIENGELKQDQVYTMDDIISMTLREYHQKQREAELRNSSTNNSSVDDEEQEVVLPVNIIPSPIDPQHVSWKGGAVFASIKLVEEMYVNREDWDILGSRVLSNKCLFDYS